MKRISCYRISASALVIFSALALPQRGYAMATPPAAPSLMLQPMAHVPHLGTPIMVRLQAGEFAIKAVTVVQKNDTWSATSQPELVRDSMGVNSIAITPLQLGEVHVAVVATLSNGLIAERRMTLEVSLPEEAPLEFHANSKDVLFLQKGATHALAPTARFAGVTQDVPIDPSLVSFKVIQDEFDDNPALDVSAHGQVHASSRGSMMVQATFMGKTSVCRVKVLPKLD